MRVWLQSRYADRTKLFYIKSRNELKQQFDAESIFFKFDDDCSGTLTLDELKDLFREYDIRLNLKELQKILDKLDKDGGGTLDLQEFREWNYNQEAKDGFRSLVHQMRADLIDSSGNYVA